MQKNDLFRTGDTIVRVLALREDAVLLLDCIKLTMPTWVALPEIQDWTPCGEEDLQKEAGIHPTDAGLPINDTPGLRAYSLIWTIPRFVRMLSGMQQNRTTFRSRPSVGFSVGILPSNRFRHWLRWNRRKGL